MSQANELSIAAPIGCLDAYFQTANRMPILSAEEEQKLARKLRDESDLDAARTLILSQLRFVIRIAKGYTGYGLALHDLVQEGNIGLMKAVRRFDPEAGVRLISFAVHWIRAEIHEFVLRNWRIVKIATTKAQRKLFFNMRRAKKSLNWFNQDEVETVARELNVKSKTVREMEKRLYAQDASFDGVDDDNQTSNLHVPAAYLTDCRLEPGVQLETENNEEYYSGRLHSALSELDPRSRNILEKRWLNEGKATLHELAAQYAVSAERIRQIEKSALDKLKTSLQS